MFLFESSYFVGNLGMQELLGYVQTSMTYFNIQKAGNNSTPVSSGDILWMERIITVPHPDRNHHLFGHGDGHQPFGDIGQ